MSGVNTTVGDGYSVFAKSNIEITLTANKFSISDFEFAHFELPALTLLLEFARDEILNQEVSAARKATA